MERVAQQRGSRIAIEIEQDLPSARVEQGAAERMFARILAATIGLAGQGETIGATMGIEEKAGLNARRTIQAGVVARREGIPVLPGPLTANSGVSPPVIGDGEPLA